MPGTIAGGRRAAATNKAKYGEDYYKNIGKKGGSVRRPETRWWNRHPEMARAAGAKGGSISKRGPARKASD